MEERRPQQSPFILAVICVEPPVELPLPATDAHLELPSTRCQYPDAACTHICLNDIRHCRRSFRTSYKSHVKGREDRLRNIPQNAILLSLYHLIQMSSSTSTSNNIRNRAIASTTVRPYLHPLWQAAPSPAFPKPHVSSR
jgi:hypothetical protein